MCIIGNQNFESELGCCTQCVNPYLDGNLN